MVLLCGTSDTWYSVAAADNKNAPFDQQFYLIMNLAAGGWFDQNVQPDEATFTSKEMYVDYVRVYQKLYVKTMFCQLGSLVNMLF